jgi:hypothetical protein
LANSWILPRSIGNPGGLIVAISVRSPCLTDAVVIASPGGDVLLFRTKHFWPPEVNTA